MKHDLEERDLSIEGLNRDVEELMVHFLGAHANRVESVGIV